MPVERVINGGGVPQNNAVLNQVYANVLNKPVLVPDGTPTSLGSAVVAFVTARCLSSIEAAQEKLCLPFRTFLPDPSRQMERYERLYKLYRKLYFALGERTASPVALGDVLPELRLIAEQARVRGLISTLPMQFKFQKKNR